MAKKRRSGCGKQRPEFTVLSPELPESIRGRSFGKLFKQHDASKMGRLVMVAAVGSSRDRLVLERGGVVWRVEQVV